MRLGLLRWRRRAPAGGDRSGRASLGQQTVMLVTFATAVGGAERSLLLLAQRLPRFGCTPVVVCPPGALAERVARAGLRVEVLALRAAGPVSRRDGGRKSYPLLTLVRWVARTITNASYLARLARRLDPSLMHSNSLSSHLAVALGGRFAGCLVVWHLREIIEPGRGRIVFNLVGRLTAGMVAISEAVAASVRHPQVFTVYNPVDEAPRKLPAARWDLPRPIVGYLGRLDPRKGLETLIEAAGMVTTDVVVVGRSWTGSPDYLVSLRELAQRHAPGRVHFVGAVEDPWQALGAMDVLVVPSLAEPFGRVAAEGQRAGVPVVVANAGGLPEIVADHHDGLVFAAGDAADLAACLQQLIADPQLRSRLSSAARISALRFDPGKHAARMAEVFHTVGTGPRRAAPPARSRAWHEPVGSVRRGGAIK